MMRAEIGTLIQFIVLDCVSYYYERVNAYYIFIYLLVIVFMSLL